eukprot:jgi/Mesvir1/19293/Mv10367-RA.1
MLKEHITAPEGFNRWLIPPAALATHMSIGSVYAWSIFNAPLVRDVGVVASCSLDWQLSDVVPVFSTAIFCLGVAAAIAGKWLEEVGPRTVGALAALCWGGGIMVGGLGVLTHQLPLLYAGYGVLGGCGLGLGYVAPVSTLIRWFPDRRGMATGLAIMGFGGGAMLATPLKEALLARFFRAPDYLGPLADVPLVTEAGRRMATMAGELREVVVATAADLAKLPVQGLPEGVYLVGTGSAGVAEAFFALGALYSCAMMAGAFSYRVPRPGWRPAGWVPPGEAAGNTPPSDDKTGAVASSATGDDKSKAAVAVNPMITRNDVHIDTALRTPQFWLLWTNLFCNITAGIGVLGVAKTLMGDIFGSTLPHVVTNSFAATYVLMLSVFNMAGRVSWASVSDYLGRKNTYFIFFGAGIPLYLSIPALARWVTEEPSLAPLVAFYGVTAAIFSMYGGGFATIPAYLADMFGTKYVGGIHGRLLTAWSLAGLTGPLLLANLRQRSVNGAIADLTSKVDPALFESTFGAPTSQLQELMATQAVTIARLMEIVPPGTIDPSPGLYNTTMYAMAGLLGVALVSNALIRPVHSKYWMTPGLQASAPTSGAAAMPLPMTTLASATQASATQAAPSPAAAATIGAAQGVEKSAGQRGVHTLAAFTEDNADLSYPLDKGSEAERLVQWPGELLTLKAEESLDK